MKTRHVGSERATGNRYGKVSSFVAQDRGKELAMGHRGTFPCGLWSSLSIPG